MAYEYDDEEDNSFWSESKRQEFNTGFYGTSGSVSSFQCSCGSWNTYQTTYVDGCNTCGDYQSY